MPTPARPCRVGPEAKPSAVLEALSRHVGRDLCRQEPDPERMHVLYKLLACRTAKLGRHLFVCADCGEKIPVYNSCRDRHCPQCQGKATAEWLEGRRERMLPTPHFQVVFTLPSELRPVAFDNQKLVYALLFRASTSVLQDLAAQRLTARLGILAVLHTWTDEIGFHPHLHCLVTAGGLHHDDDRWVPTSEDYLLDRTVTADGDGTPGAAAAVEADEPETETQPRECCPVCGSTNVYRLFFFGRGPARSARAPP